MRSCSFCEVGPRLLPDEAIASWARGHGLPVERVDGNDVEAVRAAALRAVAQIRETGRPQFLELVTYRLRGHGEPDDQAYVDKDELNQWWLRDPIRMQSDRLIAEGLLDAAGLAVMEARMRSEIEAAAAFAQASAWPAPESLTSHVYA